MKTAPKLFLPFVLLITDPLPGDAFQLPVSFTTLSCSTRPPRTYYYHEKVALHLGDNPMDELDKALRAARANSGANNSNNDNAVDNAGGGGSSRKPSINSPDGPSWSSWDEVGPSSSIFQAESLDVTDGGSSGGGGGGGSSTEAEAPSNAMIGANTDSVTTTTSSSSFASSGDSDDDNKANHDDDSKEEEESSQKKTPPPTPGRKISNLFVMDEGGALMAKIDIWATIGDNLDPDKVVNNLFGGTVGERGEAWVAIAFLLLISILIGGIPFLPYINTILTFTAGPGFLLAGSSLILASISDLGSKNLTPFLSPTPKASLVTEGIYSKIRHPIYSGLMALCIGFAVTTEDTTRLVLTTVLMFLLNIKADKEEERLMEAFPQYDSYRATTGKFFPGDWKVFS